jgi:hypothetical protein
VKVTIPLHQEEVLHLMVMEKTLTEGTNKGLLLKGKL